MKSFVETGVRAKIGLTIWSNDVILCKANRRETQGGECCEREEATHRSVQRPDDCGHNALTFRIASGIPTALCGSAELMQKMSGEPRF